VVFYDSADFSRWTIASLTVVHLGIVVFTLAFLISASRTEFLSRSPAYHFEITTKVQRKILMSSTQIQTFSANELIVGSVIKAVQNCLTMCDVTAKVVGVSTVPVDAGGVVTGMIGVHGKVTGFVSVSLPERAALLAVSGLLQDEFPQLNHQVVDGVGEITNIITGGIKTGLAGKEWSFQNMTVPSVVVGRNYHIAYAKGIEYSNVSFEMDDPETLTIQDRLFQVTISMMKV
jgi:chemotaxis protein CheX